MPKRSKKYAQNARVPALVKNVQELVWLMTTMTIASNARDQATVPSAREQAQKANMLNEPQDRVNCLMQKHRDQVNLVSDVELLLMQALWDLRGTVKVDDMLRWTGWSKQTLYNKWSKYGLKENNENS